MTNFIRDLLRHLPVDVSHFLDKRRSPAAVDYTAVMRDAERFLSAVARGDVTAGLEIVRRALGASATGITFRRADNVHQTWVGLPPTFDEAYVRHYHAHDPWVAGAERLGVEAGRAYVTAELLSDEDRRKNSFLHEVCIPHDLPELATASSTSTQPRS